MVENGLQPDLLMKSEYGHRMHVWDLRRRKIVETLDLGKENQMVLEIGQPTTRQRPMDSSA